VLSNHEHLGLELKQSPIFGSGFVAANDSLCYLSQGDDEGVVGLI